MGIKDAVKKILGSRHDREFKKAQPLVEEINGLADEFSELSEEDLKGKTAEFREYIAERVGPFEEEIRSLRAEKGDPGNLPRGPDGARIRRGARRDENR